MISNRNKWFLHAIHLSTGWRILWMIQLVPEMLVQSVFGKPYYLKAFRLYLNNYGRVRESRKNLKKLAHNQPLLSVKQVARFIQDAARGKKLKFF